MVRNSRDYSIIYRSPDQGLSWVAQTNKELDNLIIREIIQVGNDVIIGTFGNGLYRSSDTCKSFQPIRNTPIDSAAIYSIIKSGNDLIVGTYGQGIYRSSDNGLTWESSSTGLTPMHATKITSDGQNVYTCTYFQNKVLYASTDNGKTWNDASNGLPDVHIRDLVIKGDTIFAATFGDGVYMSSNKGSSWSKFGINPFNQNVNTILLFEDMLYIGTWGNGGFTSSAIIAAGVDDPQNFRNLVFPNPSNDFVTVSCDPEFYSFTSISVTNIFGQKMQLPEFEINKDNTVRINISNLNAGSYFVTFINGSSSRTSQLQVVR